MVNFHTLGKLLTLTMIYSKLTEPTPTLSPRTCLIDTGGGAVAAAAPVPAASS